MVDSYKGFVEIHTCNNAAHGAAQYAVVPFAASRYQTQSGAFVGGCVESSPHFESAVDAVKYRDAQNIKAKERQIAEGRIR